VAEIASTTYKGLPGDVAPRDAILVDEDYDLEEAATYIVQSAFGFQGQKCSACSRAIVDASVYDAFLEKVVARSRRIAMGSPEDPKNALGPVVNRNAQKKILDYVQKGTHEGRLVLGGEPGAGEGWFVQPTIIADVAPDATIAQEEIFGPVLAVIKARDWNDAIDIANNTEYGLTGGVYTKDDGKIADAKRRFHVGNLYFNRKCTGALVGVHPFGGFNMSGTDSKAGGPDYLQLFLQAKSICEQW